MLSLALHEGNPGHHLQTSYVLGQQDWPLFRKFTDDGNYGQVCTVQVNVYTVYCSSV